MTPTATRRVRTEDGVALAVEEYGPADAPVTVVFLHGWTLDRRVWRHQVADLPGQVGGPVRLVAYDHRGHGRSGPTDPGRMTIAQLGDDLAAVLRSAVPTGPVVLAGHSIGGMAVMALAEQHPRLFAERVAGIACVSTSCGGLADVRLGLPRALARLVGRAEAAATRQLARVPHGTAGAGVAVARLASRAMVSRPGLRWLLFGRRPPRAAVRHTAEMVAATPPATLAGFRATFADHDRRTALAAYRGRTTVVLGGTEDRLCPPRHPEAISAELPDATLVMVPGVGHMLPLERPAEVTRQLAVLVETVRRASDIASKNPELTTRHGDGH